MVTTRARKKAVLAQEEAEVARKLLLPFRLLDLPAEIIGNISDYLDDQDLINVRRVCRALTAHSVNAFGQRFFGHLVVILHPTSLMTLFEISRHKTLSIYVHQVTVSGERIGYAIPLTVNQEKHKDLQTSVEQSHMDLLILTEVLRELKNLQIVRVDKSSFQHSLFRTDKATIKCGRASMFDKYSVAWKKVDDNSYNRVYGLTLQALTQAQVEEKVELDLELWNPSWPQKTFKYFDIESICWRESLCNRLRCLSITGGMDRDWIGRLLSLSTGITKLELRLTIKVLFLACEQTGALSFPSLRNLSIFSTVIHHEEWLGFLRLHAPVLEKVELLSVGLQHGTWHQSLEILESMPRLDSLVLEKLWEQAPYQSSSEVPLVPPRSQPRKVVTSQPEEDQSSAHSESAVVEQM
ncbi:uncharacterized protein J4E84_010992 [Alternaria hordeiaustralica]|uniref:uncharacterized protein n=1 Tax=Alternaria hordeiaustralica TaxID=1187925 RepID=UPI0020C547B5|nr:uncharacterized protein J4E84_010992 [Alternaria hordeiaustralica]KAI4673761.1 hypothetical protein J4E84_010992 [Alternaria hordeiaustralica]